LHPRVILDLFNSWPLFAVITEDFKNQVLELIGKVLASDFLPVVVDFACKDQVVEVLVLLCLLKWEDSLNNYEKDDSGRKYVNSSSIVLLAFFNFWSHIRHCSSIGVKLVDLLVSCESEVSNLQSKIVIDQDILKLKVSVNNSFGLDVPKDIEHL